MVLGGLSLSDSACSGWGRSRWCLGTFELLCTCCREIQASQPVLQPSGVKDAEQSSSHAVFCGRTCQPHSARGAAGALG